MELATSASYMKTAASRYDVSLGDIEISVEFSPSPSFLD